MTVFSTLSYLFARSQGGENATLPCHHSSDYISQNPHLMDIDTRVYIRISYAWICTHACLCMARLLLRRR